MTSNWRLIAVTVFSALCLTNTVRGDVVNVAGSTTGTFGTPVPGLSFAGTPFDVITNAFGDAFGVDLGTFTYSAPDGFDSSSSTFNATITITAPLGTNPGSAGQVANVGALAFFGVGFGVIDFPDTPLTFNFANNTGSGSFSLTIRDTLFFDFSSGSSTAQLLGDISSSVVSMPEGPPVELLLSLVVGLGYVIKNRMSQAG